MTNTEGDNAFLYYNDRKLSEIKDIIKEYVKTEKYDTSKQSKKVKEPEELLNIVKRDSRIIFKKNAILVPRGIRAHGKIYMLEEDTNISTNFIVIKNIDEYQSIVIGTWMTTLFYQLNCEVQSKDQEGMRKMEQIDILNTYVPNISLEEKEYKNLQEEVNNINFLDLRNAEIRKIDRIWAEIIFKNRTKEERNIILRKSKKLLKHITNKRNK